MAEPNNALVESNPNFLTLPTEEFLTSYHLQPIIDDSWIREEELVHLDDLRENEGGERIKRELLQNYQVKARGSTINPVLEGMNYQEMFFAQYNQNERYTDQFAAEKYKKQNLENYRQRRPSREMNERFVEEGMPTDKVETIENAIYTKLGMDTHLPLTEKSQNEEEQQEDTVGEREI